MAINPISVPINHASMNLNSSVSLSTTFKCLSKAKMIGKDTIFGYYSINVKKQFIFIYKKSSTSPLLSLSNKLLLKYKKQIIY